MQNVVINVNGQIVDLAQAKVPVLDRSFLYGDSLYEVVRSYHGVLLHMTEHLARLEKSATLCKMRLDQSSADYEREIRKTFEAFRARPGNAERDIYCRLVVSRGVGKIGFGVENLMTPSQYVIIVQPLSVPTEEQYAHGLSLKVVERLRNDPRALDPAMKSGNYLNSILAYLEAAESKFDDALLCNADAHITEGTTFNIFYARNDIIATPPLEIGILDGITRTGTIQMARQLGYDVREVRFPKERLYEADEVFVTSTTKDVFPVTRVDGKLIGRKASKGKPGPITAQLRKAYQADSARRAFGVTGAA